MLLQSQTDRIHAQQQAQFAIKNTAILVIN
ncbi:hypothetical protein LMG28140_06162 [Paraburkholderia metrosideri]|jgi:hypothetical protein|uniref:Uncharacterized protein n=1 Tax=Paraburkholderia metrosideri TaxID=580937 RepID=A0ABN7IEK7_9BURK|nr:hypothetical protein LMG28140_06162 [Paraburkholderia metrosideri]